MPRPLPVSLLLSVSPPVFTTPCAPTVSLIASNLDSSPNAAHAYAALPSFLPLPRSTTQSTLTSTFASQTSGGAPVKTMTKEWQEASNQIALEQKQNPITGIASENYKGPVTFSRNKRRLSKSYPNHTHIFSLFSPCTAVFCREERQSRSILLHSTLSRPRPNRPTFIASHCFAENTENRSKSTGYRIQSTDATFYTHMNQGVLKDYFHFVPEREDRLQLGGWFVEQLHACQLAQLLQGWCRIARVDTYQKHARRANGSTGGKYGVRQSVSCRSIRQSAGLHPWPSRCVRLRMSASHPKDNSTEG